MASRVITANIGGDDLLSRLNDLAPLFPSDWKVPTFDRAVVDAGIAHAEEVIEACVERACSISEADCFDMNIEERCAVVLYTFDFGPEESDKNPYCVINKALYTRSTLMLRKMRGLLYLLLAGLRKMPRVACSATERLYRGITTRVSVDQNHYRRGNRITWHSFTSTSLDMEVTKNFLTNKETGVCAGSLFFLKNSWGYDLQAFSFVPSEREILLEPEVQFLVESVLDSGTLLIIELTFCEDSPLLLTNLISASKAPTQTAGVKNVEGGAENRDEKTTATPTAVTPTPTPVVTSTPTATPTPTPMPAVSRAPVTPTPVTTPVVATPVVATPVVETSPPPDGHKHHHKHKHHHHKDSSSVSGSGETPLGTSSLTSSGITVSVPIVTSPTALPQVQIPAVIPTPVAPPTPTPVDSTKTLEYALEHHICTLTATGETLTAQPWNWCNTCNPDWQTSRVGYCQSCALRCHSNHDLVVVPSSKSFCDCQNADCKKPDPYEDGIRKAVAQHTCTRTVTGANYCAQEFYSCYTCFPNCDETGVGCCQSCAERCHSGHNLTHKFSVQCFCDCEQQSCKRFDPYADAITQCVARNQCTYVATGSNPSSQKWYWCETCNPDWKTSRVGYCDTCARLCHKRHTLIQDWADSCYCDCAKKMCKKGT
ncbi:hypothetical protein Pelo_15094 [Pelomyxa schiedti]|nr:hypothetical protein Pelo_15094 [Pelomyxa schiedti]